MMVSKSKLLGSLVVAIFSLGGVSSQAVTVSAAKTLQTEAGLSAEEIGAFAGAMMDDVAIHNIENAYLPIARSAIEISQSRDLSDDQKQVALNKVVQLANESLEAQKGDFTFRLISTLVTRKLDQFHNAVQRRNFTETASLAISARALLKGLSR